MHRFCLAPGRAALLLAVFLSSSTLHAQDRSDLFLLSVGVDGYQAPTNKLSGCINDATGIAKVFQTQAGKRFGRVDFKLLTDASATHAQITGQMRELETKGRAGDWLVLFLSGHGGIVRDKWAFLTQDNQNLTDDVILGLADRAAASGKKVFVIIDACHAGHLRYAGAPVLNRHSDPSKGGIVLMVSSMPDQLSAALGAYSAFAQAVEAGLKGRADYDGDGIVTLKELRRFSYNEVYELQRRKRTFPGLTVSYQDSAIDASLSIPETLAIVEAKAPAAPAPIDDGPEIKAPGLIGREWKVTQPATKFAPPTTFELKLEATGAYRAVLKQGLKAAGMSTGTYRVRSKALELIHHQGMDRLQIVSLSAGELRFRFQEREFLATTDASASSGILVDASGRLSPEDPRDRIRTGAPHKVHMVRLEAGGNYVLDLESSDFDAYLRIEDAAGVSLAEDDDSGGERNARLRFSPRATGEYRVIATAYSGAGIYHLKVQRVGGPRPPDRIVAGGTILLDVNHALQADDSKDNVRTSSFAKSYKLNFKKGAPYKIDLISSDFDTYLRIEDETGKEVASDDDGGEGRNSRLSFVAPQDGAYRLVATSFLSATGRYRLIVKGPGTASGPGRSLTLTGGAARVADALTAEDARDGVRKGSHCKVYVVSMEAGGRYTIDLKSAAFDAYLRIEDSMGRQLAQDDDGGDGHNARLVFTPPAAGSYRIIATTYNDNETGAFTLTIER